MSTNPTAIDSALRILAVDDEARIRKALQRCLERDSHTVTPVADADAARQAIREGAYHVAFLDLRLGEESGMELIPDLLDAHPDLKIIVITAHASIGTAVEAMRRGASDYLPKPFTPEQVRLALRKVVDLQALHHRVALLESDLKRSAPARLTSSESPRMQAVLDEARQVADSDACSFKAKAEPEKACWPAQSTRGVPVQKPRSGWCTAPRSRTICSKASCLAT